MPICDDCSPIDVIAESLWNLEDLCEFIRIIVLMIENGEYIKDGDVKNV